MEAAQVATSGEPADQRDLLSIWWLRCYRAIRNQRGAARRYRGLHVIFTAINACGAVAVLFLANADVFFAVHKGTATTAVNICGAILVITSITQMIFNFESRAAAFFRQSNDYSKLMRKIEVKISSEKWAASDIEEISREYELVQKDENIVPSALWDANPQNTETGKHLTSLNFKMFGGKIEGS